MHALEPILLALPRFVAALLFLALARWLFPRVTPYNVTHEIAEADNPAFAAVLVGFMGAAALALCGALFGANGDPVHDLMSVGIGGVATLILLPLSSWLCDRGLLRGYPVVLEITRDRNLGAGFVVGGASLATGLVIQGALTGHSDGLLLLVRDILVYWAAGQALLLLAGVVFQKLMPFDVHERIEHDDNAAVGLAFGGFLVGMGLLVRAALEGASSDVVVELGVIAAWGLMGLVVMSGAAVLLDRVLLPGVPVARELVEDRNVAVGAVVAASFVATAWLLAAALHPTPNAQPAGAEAIHALDVGAEPDLLDDGEHDDSEHDDSEHDDRESDDSHDTPAVGDDAAHPPLPATAAAEVTP